MMGEHAKSEGLFYYFKLEEHVPQTHLLRLIDRHVDFGFLRNRLRPLYSETGRPSVDPEVLLRMLLIGYLYGITSERRLCEDVGMHLAYRWFLGLGFDQAVPHHSTFSKNRHGRFRDQELFRDLFEEIVGRCLAAGLVEGESFSVDGSVIEADAGRASRVRRDELAEVAKVSHKVLSRVVGRFGATSQRYCPQMRPGKALALDWRALAWTRPQHILSAGKITNLTPVAIEVLYCTG